MLEYRKIEGHWKDEPQVKHQMIVVQLNGDSEIVRKDGQVIDEFEKRLQQELGLSDDEVFYYQHEWDPSNICDGDFVVDEVLESSGGYFKVD